MPNLVKPLDQSSAYVACPICERTGNAGVALTREMHNFKCRFGHQFGSLAELEGASMVKMNEAVVVEQPSPHSVAWKIYVHPQIRAKIEERYAGRVWTTLGTFMDCLADGAILIVSGEDVKKLKAMGISNGAQMVSALESAKQIEKDRQDALEQLAKVQSMMKAIAGPPPTQ